MVLIFKYFQPTVPEVFPRIVSERGFSETTIFELSKPDIFVPEIRRQRA